ncbi:acyl-CoA dehydrogenase family protein [Amycolatopsis sp. H20-H5]|uniref:acyl-CoA dehydrogenase family protein n=1 Tax=Amycolatopsis sp. H20-H5 TaxID=3046309 RepID=UPI002DBCA52F|nr:acyl-CoA dehydrogenase family protein [Amycolatopsis sp. H20-H5]MEC3979052.1 acyl-CoA dehydrogenase family protein [Amycolatopsis sp. H20-H5]
MRRLATDVAGADEWRPGSHVDDRSASLSAGLRHLGGHDLTSGDEDTLPFLATAAVELGRAATTVYDIVQVLGGSPLVGGLAMYAQPNQLIALGNPGGYRVAAVLSSTPVVFADSLGVHSMDATEDEGTLTDGDKRLTAWEAATVGYFAGLASFVVDFATEHARSREIFGATLAHVDAVQQRLADAATTADALVLSAREGAHGLPALAHAASSTWDVMLHGHLIFGAIGFTMEFPLQRYSRRTKALGSFVDGWIDQRIGSAR